MVVKFTEEIGGVTTDVSVNPGPNQASGTVSLLPKVGPIQNLSFSTTNGTGESFLGEGAAKLSSHELEIGDAQVQFDASASLLGLNTNSIQTNAQMSYSNVKAKIGYFYPTDSTSSASLNSGVDIRIGQLGVQNISISSNEKIGTPATASLGEVHAKATTKAILLNDDVGLNFGTSTTLVGLATDKVGANAKLSHSVGIQAESGYSTSVSTQSQEIYAGLNFNVENAKAYLRQYQTTTNQPESNKQTKAKTEIGMSAETGKDSSIYGRASLSAEEEARLDSAILGVKKNLSKDAVIFGEAGLENIDDKSVNPNSELTPVIKTGVQIKF